MWTNQALEVLAHEFNRNAPEEGRERMKKSIENGESVLTYILDGSELAAAGIHKTYSWERLKDQLYYQPDYDESGFMIKVRLRKFVDQLADAGLPIEHQKVGEVAYMYVKPEFRGKGYGRQLFELQTAALQRDSLITLLFTLAQGPYAQTPLVGAALELILQKEKEQNGTREDGRALVTGVYVSTSEIMMAAGGQHYQIDQLNQYTGSEATVHLAEQDGFTPLGFSRNFSPLWVKPVSTPNTEL